jgi:hypothetical protein
VSDHTFIPEQTAEMERAFTTFRRAFLHSSSVCPRRTTRQLWLSVATEWQRQLAITHYCHPAPRGYTPDDDLAF